MDTLIGTVHWSDGCIDVGDRCWGTKCIGDNFEMLVLAVLVTNIKLMPSTIIIHWYRLPTFKKFHQYRKSITNFPRSRCLTNITMSPTSLSPVWLFTLAPCRQFWLTIWNRLLIHYVFQPFMESLIDEEHPGEEILLLFYDGIKMTVRRQESWENYFWRGKSSPRQKYGVMTKKKKIKVYKNFFDACKNNFKWISNDHVL